jgi:uncharacterized membrane protein
MWSWAFKADFKELHHLINRLLPYIFFAVAAPYCLMLGYLTPPFQAPDEHEHYWYARVIASGTILPRDLSSVGVGGDMSLADAQLPLIFFETARHTDVKVSREMFARAGALVDDGSTVEQNYWGAAIYLPIAYAVPALAMKASDLLGASRLQSYYAGRFANAFLFLILSATAIRIVPTGKMAFAFILLLPMTLFQAVSFSADSFAFSFSALACALIARASVRPNPLAPQGLALATVFITILACVKTPMVALALPTAAAAAMISRLFAWGSVVVIVAGCVIWANWFTLTEGFEARLDTLNNVSTARQFDFLLSSPLSVFEIAVNTLHQWGTWYVRSAVGILGWLNAPFAEWFYELAYATGFLVFIATIFASPALAGSVRLAFLMAGILAAGLVFGALYLSWTPVGANIVHGVQGRYFIPVFMPLALACSGTLGRWSQVWMTTLTMLILLGFCAISIVHVGSTLVTRYYLN